MTGQHGLLKAEELDFLLDQETSTGPSEGEGIGTEGQQVSIRGNLEQIQLADIFQTLAISKLEGTLRIRTPIEHREVLFKDGMVRCFTPLRAGTRRIGQRLIREGLLTTEELRPALLQQRERRIPLGQLLVEDGIVSQEIIDAFVRRQGADDLYAIFTWRHGSFEFYRGPSLDPVARAQLEFMPSFDANGVLLEVARRSDDWERIQQTFHATDEVVERLVDAPPEGLEEDCVLVFGAIDGRTTIRELADNTLLGLFECARALLTLSQHGLVQLVSIDTLLDLGNQHVESGDLKRALVAVQAAHDRPEIEQTNEAVETMVAILERCGEAQLAASYLLDAGNRQVEPAPRLEFGRKARELDPHEISILEFLRNTITDLRVPATGELKEEFLAILGDLADAYSETGETEQALAIVEEIAGHDQESQQNLMRKAKLLHKLGKPTEAIAVLLALSELLKATNRSDRLAQVYEQILKIDFRRRDIAKALKALHTSPRSRWVKFGAVAATLAALAIVGVMIHSRGVFKEQLDSTAQQVRELLEAGRPEQAMAVLESCPKTVSDDQAVEALRAKVRAMMFEREHGILEAARKSREARLAAAADYIERGELRSALALYADLMKSAKESKDLEQIVTTRVQSLLPRLEGLARSLPFQIPVAPSVLQSENARVQIMKDLAANFRDADEIVANGAIEAHNDPLLERWLGGEQRTRIFTAAKTVREAFVGARVRSKEYGEAQARVDSARRLEPVLIGAREYEKKFEFERALEAYRKLATEHPTNDELKAHFRDQVERYASILKFLQVIQRATKDGDFATAQGQLRALRRAHQNIPFDSLVELPLRIESLPAGARVLCDGREVGKTPLLIAKSPAKESRIEVELQGFQTEEVVVKGDNVGLVRSLLALVPAWTVTLPGLVERSGSIDSDKTAFFSDRAGFVTAIRTKDGSRAWQFKSADLSALLTTPVVTQGGIVVGSIDGPLRCLDKTSGLVRWEVPGLAIESAPALFGETIVAATTSGQVLGLHSSDGSVLWRAQAPAAVRNAILGVDQLAIVVTTNGFVVALASNTGAERWRTKVGDTNITAPVGNRRTIVVAAEEGTVTALGTQDGGKIWRQTDLGQLTTNLVLVGNQVLVAEGKTLTGLAVDSGKKLGSFQTDQLWSGEPAFDGSKVILGTRGGSTLVIDPVGISLGYRLKGPKPSQAAALVTGPSEVVLGFADKTISCYRALP